MVKGRESRKCWVSKMYKKNVGSITSKSVAGIHEVEYYATTKRKNCYH